MAIPTGRTASFSRSRNVGDAERWVSALAGIVLTVVSARRGGVLGRLAMGTAGLSLLTRGATGYCAVKDAINGQASLKSGLREQWQRVRAGIGSDVAEIDSLEDMYLAELQELYSAERQFSDLALKLAGRIAHSPLAVRIDEYGEELKVRAGEAQQLLRRCGVEADQHPDQAMASLITETHKMAQVCAVGVRDAALLASIQRLVHYKIAGYGTIASYAKALGRLDEAARFAILADRDKAIDAELSELAKGTLNPDALVSPAEQAAAEQARTH